MWTIVNQDGKFLYYRVNESPVVGEISIEQIYSGEIPEGTELYFNFETKEFYLI